MSKFKQLTYNTIPFVSRLWRHQFFPLSSGLWISRVRKRDGKKAWLTSVWYHAIRPQFFPFLDRWTRRGFISTVKDGGFWRRLYLYMMNYQCDWHGCELCRGFDAGYDRDDDDE